MIAEWRYVNIFTATQSGLGPPYASVPECQSAFEHRRESNVPWPSVLACFFSHIVDEKALCEAIWRIVVFDLSAGFLAAFLPYARNGPGCHWGIGART